MSPYGSSLVFPGHVCGNVQIVIGISGLCEVSPYGSSLVFPGHVCGNVQIVVGNTTYCYSQVYVR